MCSFCIFLETQEEVGWLTMSIYLLLKFGIPFFTIMS